MIRICHKMTPEIHEKNTPCLRSNSEHNDNDNWKMAEPTGRLTAFMH